MKTLTQKDKRILVITGICILLILIFWVFVYFPTVTKVRSLKREIRAIEKELAGVESRGGKEGRDIKKMVDSIHSDFNTALQRFPPAEESALKFISSEANKYKLDIFFMRPGPKRPMLNVANAPVLMEGKQCFEMPVTMEMKGAYKSIEDFLKALRQSTSILVGVEDISIRKDPAAAHRLNMKLELVLCLSSQ